MNDLISKRAVLAKINLWVNGGCDTDKLIESIKKMSGGSLTDRPCEYCNNHVDGRCAAWDCAFDDVLSSSENPNKWIPIKTRPLTNKEKEEYADLGYSEDSIDSMYDCHLPEDGEEVLITTRYDEVTTDTFYRDEGCYFETYCDKDDVTAWMPLPEPYKAEGSGEE